MSGIPVPTPVEAERVTAALQAALSSKPIQQRSLWRDALRRLLRNRLSLIGLIMSSFFVFLAVFGPVIAPYPYAWFNATFTYADTGPLGRISTTPSIPVMRTWSMFTDVTIAEPGTVLSSIPGELRL